MKLDLSQPGAIQAAVDELAARRRAIADEISQLKTERDTLRAAPPALVDVMALLTRQVDAAAAWAASKLLHRELDVVTFSTLDGRTARPTMPTQASGEPHVFGMLAGDSVLCMLFREQVLEGLRRQVATRDFSTAGPAAAARNRTLSDIDARIEELEELAASIDAQLNGIRGLVPVPSVAELEAAAQRAARIERNKQRAPAGAIPQLTPGGWQRYYAEIEAGRTPEEAHAIASAQPSANPEPVQAGPGLLKRIREALLDRTTRMAPVTQPFTKPE